MIKPILKFAIKSIICILVGGILGMGIEILMTNYIYPGQSYATISFLCTFIGIYAVYDIIFDNKGDKNASPKKE